MKVSGGKALINFWSVELDMSFPFLNRESIAGVIPAAWLNSFEDISALVIVLKSASLRSIVPLSIIYIGNTIIFQGKKVN